MLIQLTISQFAIIEHVDVHFARGMTVITGETGAGKSILFDALGLCLGARADNKMIRGQAKRADLTAVFDISQLPSAKQWLDEHELEQDDTCILRRTINQDGPSRGYINGTPVPLQTIKEFSEQLVTICGQHEQHHLQKPERQLQRLDDFANHHELLAQITLLYRDWRNLQTELTQLQNTTAQQSQIDLLQYQLDELNELGLTDAAEITELQQRCKQLNAAGTVAQQCQAIQALCDGDRSVTLQLHHAAQQLNTLSNTVPQFIAARDALQNAIIQIEEAVSDVAHINESLEIDEQQLIQLNQRLDQLHNIARKHKVAMIDLPEYVTTLAAQIAKLAERDTRIAELTTQQANVAVNYQKIAVTLTKQRQLHATKLSQLITQHLHQLGMPHGRFAIELTSTDLQTLSPRGNESAMFMFSANPDQPLQPLAKVASGGELARVSLAIQVVTAQSEAVPTLLFDEVDVGIGGGTAEIVGNLLRQLADSAQVMCVTHQPQVAACAKQHFQVSKTAIDGQTQTHITQLTAKERIEELARMLGGIKITAKTRKHAEEMLLTLSA